MEDKIEKDSGGWTMWVSECCVKQYRDFLVVQWLGLQASIAGSSGLYPW